MLKVILWSFLFCLGLNSCSIRYPRNNIVQRSITDSTKELLEISKTCMFRDKEFRVLNSNESDYLECYTRTKKENVGLNKNRKVVHIPDLSTLMNNATNSSTTVFEICALQSGEVILSRLFETDEKEIDLINIMHLLSFQYEFEKDLSAPCLQCGKFTFDLELLSK